VSPAINRLEQFNNPIFIIMKKENKKKLPVYRLIIDPHDDVEGIDAISFVTEPAIEVPFLKFAYEREPLKFAIADEDQQVILGPVLIPNKMIYRKNFEGNEEANVYFAPEDVELIVQKFFKQKNEGNINLEHSLVVDGGAYLYQAFISDKENGINPKQFEDLEDKTFFAKYKVTDPDLWQSVKEGVFTGFSLEGFFNSIEIKQSVQLSDEEILQKVIELLGEI